MQRVWVGGCPNELGGSTRFHATRVHCRYNYFFLFLLLQRQLVVVVVVVVVLVVLVVLLSIEYFRLHY